MKKLIPLLAIVIAAIGGLFGGEMLRPQEGAADQPPSEGEPQGTNAQDGAPEAAEADHRAKGSAKTGAPQGEATTAYFRFPSQFFVPVMHGDRLDGVMVMTLTVEMPVAQQEAIFKQEFRLRDAFLRTLLIQANTGGFDGNYTIEPRMRRLRESLMKTAAEVTGGVVLDVLIEDIARQDAA
ncbi:hypothetical protein [uncultured Paracoccus sp.]|uniref:hypothetical protein n=1 Tax=uncultured Paracoccus sp. TaxID=189685 RepID=UPI002631223A|nr:hypothetical protein [uncultured Paracoccus sp.]